MKIIDRNQDFYDYFQNIYRDDTFVFDRRSSYVLTKKELIKRVNYWGVTPFILLQACNNFWLFIVKNKNWYTPEEGEIKLVCSWCDYRTKRELIRLSQINFISRLGYHRNMNWVFKIEHEEAPFGDKIIENIKNAIVEKDFEEMVVFENFREYKQKKGGGYEEEIRHYPILKDTGLTSMIDAFELYKAIEEYFSLEKTASERTESVGLTNNEKITNHGFDLKDSFRGKVK